MTRFIIRRVLISIPVVFGIIFLVFLLARVIPGDPCIATLGERATPEQCQQFAVRFGLDQSIPIQFVRYVQGIASGDLGQSIQFHQPVTDLIIARLPTTIELSALALFLAIVFGVGLGVIAAYRRNSKADVATMILANLGISTPVFVLGLILAFSFAILLKGTFLALPPSGRLSPGVTVHHLDEVWAVFNGATGPVKSTLDFLSGFYLFTALVTFQWNAFVDAFRHLILPAIALGTIPLAIIARITRSSLLDVMGREYVRTGRAKGLNEWRLLVRHALPNAILPVVTIIGLQIGLLIGGAVLTETVFGLSGVGKALVDAINARDYVVIQGFTLMISIGFMIVNLIVDISYAYLDPRIKVS